MILSTEPSASAVIYGCQGLSLTPEEATFFRDVQPFGFILFARNIDTPDQVRCLIEALRETVNRSDAPVLIDQEGGRVQRLKPPYWRQCPPAQVLANLGGERANEAITLNSRLIGRELADLGITVNCAPVLDVAFSQTHDVIGDRAYSGQPETVAYFAKLVCNALLAEGIHPVIKHIPGHGRAMCDSHLELPRVEASVEELREIDFKPFIELADEDWAMTAHIVYTAFDDQAPATCSEIVIRDVIRREIGFSGLLMSDDLSMKALSGDFQERTRNALDAGCDMVLHCNGEMAEMKEISEAVRPLRPGAWQRFSLAELRRTEAHKHAPELGSKAEILDRLNSLIS